MIIGLTGLMASGKGEVVKLLTEKGFRHITLSDLIRAEARKQNLEESRENLQNLGNQMRLEQGAGILAIKALEIIKSDPDQDWVIDGIRNPAEINELRKIENITIIGIHANKEILIKRILSRDRKGDVRSREEVESLINKGLGINQPKDGQQVGECMRMVDHLIVNEGTLEELRAKIIAEIET